MTLSTDSSLGIRDRKRLETRARIEDAAIFLVLRDGLDTTTVDAISERADVSPRTFFNYFDSKDGAILGIRQRDVNDELMAEHVTLYRHEQDERQGPEHRPATSHLVASVIRLLSSVMGPPLASRATVQADRLEILKRHPQVLSGQFAQLTARADRLVETIDELAAATPGFTSEDERRAQSELLLSLCGGALRVAVREWVSAGDETDVDHIENRAHELIEQIVGNLA